MITSPNRKICAAGAAILAVAFVFSLSPWYRAYCADDHRWTCAKVRKVLQWDYAHRIEDGESGSVGLLVEVLELRHAADEFTVVPASSVTPADAENPEGTIITGLCKDGGAFLIHEDADGMITVTCDVPGHDVDYADYLNQDEEE